MFKILAVILYIGEGMIMSSFSQEDKSKIFWSENYTLEADDFQGGNLSDSYTNIAETHADIAFSFREIDKNTLEIQISAYFDKKKSRINKKYINDQKLIIHEQFHFNIVEMYARQLRKKVIEYRFSSKNYRNQYIKLHTKIINQIGKMQILYDDETKHGTDNQKQKEWEEKLLKQLDDLKEYADTKVVAKLK